MSTERLKPHGNENPNQGRVRSFLKGVLGKPDELTPVHETGIPTSPDLSGDNNGVGSKHNVLAIARTPARLPKTPSKERSQTAPPPTQEDIRAANAGELAPRGITKIMLDAARNHPVGTGIAATAALTAAAYAIPAIHEKVNSSVAGWWNSVGDLLRAPSFEERFPIVLPQNGFTSVSKEEEQELWENTKTVDLENHTFTIGFPVNQATIDKSPNLRMNSYFEPKLLLGVNNISELESAGIKNVNQISGFPKDTPIYFSYDQSKFSASVIKIGIAGETQGEGSNSFTPAYTTFRIFLRDMQTGDNYSIIVSGLYASPLIEANPYPTDHSAVFEDGTPITPNTPIFQLTTDLQDWDGTNQVLPGQGGQITFSNVGGVKANPNPSGVPTLTPVFLKNSTGNVASQE